MYRKLTMMAILTGIVFNTQAQQFFNPLSPQQSRHLSITNALSQRKQISKKQQKPTAIKQRVVGQAVYTTDGVDSTSYSYAGAKGSSYNYSKMYGIGYSTDFWPDFNPAVVSQGDISSYDVLAQSLETFYADGETESALAYYNVVGLLDSAVTNNGNGFRKFEVTYDGSGRITKFSHNSYEDEGSFASGFTRRLNYTDGRVTTDSTFNHFDGSLIFDYIREYTYSAAGQLTEMKEGLSGGGDGYYLYQFRYDATDRLRASDAILVVGLMTIPLSSDTIGYTEGVDFITLYQQSFFGDEPMAYRTLQFPGAHEGPDSIKMQSLDEDVWMNEGTAYLTYNDFGNPNRINIVPDAADPEDLIEMVKFYYETYDDGTTSNHDVSLGKIFSVFPNPFANCLNIEYKGKDKERVQVQLHDIGGRIILAGNKVLKQGNNVIEIPQLPPGTYLLTIKNGQGTFFTQKMIHH